ARVRVDCHFYRANKFFDTVRAPDEGHLDRGVRPIAVARLTKDSRRAHLDTRYTADALRAGHAFALDLQQLRVALVVKRDDLATPSLHVAQVHIGKCLRR